MTNTDVSLAVMPDNKEQPAKGTIETGDISKPKPVGSTEYHTSDNGVDTSDAIVRDNGSSPLENSESRQNASSSSFIAGGPPVNTAEKLRQAISYSSVPLDPLTREHFGFSKVDTYEDEVRLIGLYKGLLYLLPQPPSLKTVEQWQLNNKIAGGIYHTYKSQGGESDYFSWFKKNQHIVDRNYANPNGPRDAPSSRSTTLDEAVWKAGFGRHSRN